MPRVGRNVTGKRQRQKRARDFGDDPNIRHSHGEHTKHNPNEPWERRYQKKKRQKKKK